MGTDTGGIYESRTKGDGLRDASDAADTGRPQPDELEGEQRIGEEL